ncbi:MAG: stage II sporulation protein R [Clostridiales bacterium]|nr:stage II sporulation protein R [Clostridiales bacterium]
MKKIILVVGVILALIIGRVSNYSKSINTGLASNMIRLHVVANSNSTNDQILKLKVRDKVLDYTKVLLRDSVSIDDTQRIISQNLGNISNFIKKYMDENCINYNVKVQLGEFPFPTKAYGDVVLPAGYYQALKVLIGEAKGNNWWCVLFPPLCFVDATHGRITDDVKQKLKQDLTTEQYDIITKTNKTNDIPIKIKFKVVELYQTSRVAITKLINRGIKC